jgi:hypothetical protein
MTTTRTLPLSNAQLESLTRAAKLVEPAWRERWLSETIDQLYGRAWK